MVRSKRIPVRILRVLRRSWVLVGSLVRCGSCGKEILSGEPAQVHVAFVEGGALYLLFRCRECRVAEPGSSGGVEEWLVDARIIVTPPFTRLDPIRATRLRGRGPGGKSREC